MIRIHYLQHVPFENPGSIIPWAINNGHKVTSTLLYDSEMLPAQEAFDWLIIMGGSMNIYEEERYPWLKEEKAFIKAAIDSKKVVLGFCLGGQLIADAIGGKVTRNKYSEIGWFPVHLHDAAKKSALFASFPSDPVVFQWHGDTFSSLPKEAILLASSEGCEKQAFIFKERVIGFQYHMESTLSGIESLIEKCGEEMVPDIYVQSVETILSGIEHIRQNNIWMSTFLNKLEEQYKRGF